MDPNRYAGSDRRTTRSAFNSNGGTATQWGSVARGTSLSLPNVSKDFIDHATEENYDNWYNGSALEESLKTKIFNIRTGVALPTALRPVWVPAVSSIPPGIRLAALSRPAPRPVCLGWRGPRFTPRRSRPPSTIRRITI